MKRYTAWLLALYLAIAAVIMPASASVQQPITDQTVSGSAVPVSYLPEYANYGNVVGCLNADGSKTVYIFADTVAAWAVEEVTGLPLPSADTTAVMQPQSESANRSLLQDATVYADRPSTNYGTQTTLYVGKHPTYGYARSYIKFDLSSLGGVSHKNVLSAHLHWKRSTYTANAAIEAYLVTDDWSESTITWNNRPDYYNGERMGATNISTSTNKGVSQEMYITKAVMAWLQGMANYGLMLKEKEDNYQNAVYSRNTTVTANQPYLTITYTDETAPKAQGVLDGATYNIINRRTGKCLTYDSYATEANVYLAAGSVDLMSRQQWKITPVNDTQNRFYITPGVRTDLCLAVPYRNVETKAYLETAANSVLRTWQLERSWNGSYSLRSVFSKGICLKTDEAGEDVFLHGYQCDLDFSDEWTLVPTEKGNAGFFDFDENATNIDTTYGVEVMKSKISLGNFLGRHFTNANASLGFNWLQNSDFFFFTGHGAPGELLFYAPKVNGLEQISKLTVNGSVNSLTSLSPNALARQRLTILSSCESGKDAAENEENTSGVNDNMTGRLYWLGSHNVISYYHETLTDGQYRGADIIWNSAFMTQLLLGDSLGEAKQRADWYLYNDLNWENTYQIYPFGNLNERHELGDDSYRPFYDVALQQGDEARQYNTTLQLTFTTDYENGLNAKRAVTRLNGSRIGKRFTLPSDSDYRISDVYVDENKGVYWYYTGTDVLHSYKPYTDNLELGEAVVNPTAAATVARSFLTACGYDITGYTITTSNSYSKNYTIQFEREGYDNQSFVFHMQADVSGQVYIKDFVIYHKSHYQD